MSKIITLSDSRGELIIRVDINFFAADALALSRTHERFRHLAQYSFRLYPKSVELTLTNDNNNNDNKLYALECALANIGPLVRINQITFNGSNGAVGKSEFHAFIEANYRRWKLKALKFVHTEFELADADEYELIFENLEKLELSKCCEQDDGAYEAMILQCIRLKELKLIDIGYFSFQFIQKATAQLKSLHIEKVKFWNDSKPCVLTIRSQIKYLILRHVPVMIKCPSKNLTSLHTLELDSIECSAPCKLLAYNCHQLKHLHLANLDSNGTQLRNLGNQLESISLIKCVNFRPMYIYKLLQNNQNLRSVKLWSVGNETMFKEVPRRIPNVEHLHIWPAREDRPFNFDGMEKLTKLKSFTFISPKYIDTVACVGLLFRPTKRIKNTQKFSQFKALESLTMIVRGPRFLNRKIEAQIKKYLPNLKKLKLLNYNEDNLDKFHEKCSSDVANDFAEEFSQSQEQSEEAVRVLPN